MGYVPEQFNRLESLDDLQEYLRRALEQISKNLSAVENVELQTLHVEPSKRNVGMLVLADGTNWNPGSGAGVYRWTGSAWVFLG